MWFDGEAKRARVEELEKLANDTVALAIHNTGQGGHKCVLQIVQDLYTMQEEMDEVGSIAIKAELYLSRDAMMAVIDYLTAAASTTLYIVAKNSQNLRDSQENN